MRDAYQQGHADGMCGLYAVLNFLTAERSTWGESANDTLWYLLDACRHLGWLTPHHLTAGFEDYQLKAILDLQIENYRLEYKTHFVAEVEQAKRYGSFKKLAEAVVARGGGLVASHDSRHHWVLIRTRSGHLSVVDSSNKAEPIKPFSSGRAFGLDSGFVILPHQRAAIAVDL